MQIILAPVRDDCLLATEKQNSQLPSFLCFWTMGHATSSDSFVPEESGTETCSPLCFPKEYQVPDWTVPCVPSDSCKDKVHFSETFLRFLLQETLRNFICFYAAGRKEGGEGEGYKLYHGFSRPFTKKKKINVVRISLSPRPNKMRGEGKAFCLGCCYTTRQVTKIIFTVEEISLSFVFLLSHKSKCMLCAPWALNTRFANTVAAKTGGLSSSYTATSL